MAGKGTYNGGSSTIRVGEDGTHWNGECSNSEDKKTRKRRRRFSDRRPTEKEIQEEERREIKREKMVAQAFISACALAYMQGKLAESFPKPPTPLARSVRSYGGNVKWLGGSKERQVHFHSSYCKHRGSPVPFESVWSTSDE